MGWDQAGKGILKALSPGKVSTLFCGNMGSLNLGGDCAPLGLCPNLVGDIPEPPLSPQA